MSEVASAAPRSRGRRRPRFLRGVRRMALVLLVAIWLLAAWAGSGSGSFVRAGGAALLASAVVGVVYFAIYHWATSGRGSVRHFLRDWIKARKKRRMSRLDRAVQLVTWVAAGSAAWLVMNFPDYEPDTRELLFALVVSVTLAVGVVQLVAWVLKGFVKSE